MMKNAGADIRIKERISALMSRDEIKEAEKAMGSASLREGFSREACLLAYMISKGKIGFDEYMRIAEKNSDSNEDCGDKEHGKNKDENRYVDLFDMAPRPFGQNWGESHIRELFPQFRKASKKELADEMPEFDGEFDLWLNGIKVEVKACRAVRKSDKGSLADRALSHEEAKETGFRYHFQQIKPSCCDVFIWIGVCRDEILYWVLTGEDLKRTGRFGSQHRTPDGAESEPFEGQIFMTEEELKPFSVKEADVLSEVLKKNGRG